MATKKQVDFIRKLEKWKDQPSTDLAELEQMPETEASELIDKLRELKSVAANNRKNPEAPKLVKAEDLPSIEISKPTLGMAEKLIWQSVENQKYWLDNRGEFKELTRDLYWLLLETEEFVQGVAK